MRPNQQDDHRGYVDARNDNMFTYLDANDRQRGPCSLSQLFSWCADGQLPAQPIGQQMPADRAPAPHLLPDPRRTCPPHLLPGTARAAAQALALT